MRVLLVQGFLKSGRNHIIRGSGDLYERSGDLGVVQQAVEWNHFNHN